MPTDKEIEAAAEAIHSVDYFGSKKLAERGAGMQEIFLKMAKAALEAAEKVRKDTVMERILDDNIEIYELLADR